MTAIDGQSVKTGRETYAEPIPVEPGLRTIQLTFTHGSTLANIATTAELRPGRRYVAKTQRGRRPVLWIEDAETGEPITTRMPVQATTSQTIFIPMMVR